MKNITSYNRCSDDKQVLFYVFEIVACACFYINSYGFDSGACACLVREKKNIKTFSKSSKTCEFENYNRRK